jgi:uncharacterized protein
MLDSKRLEELDLLRGVALLGILLINIQIFSTTFFLFHDWFEKYNNPVDIFVFETIDLLVSQRFIGIFSLLFGLGIAIQKQTFEKRNLPFIKYYFQRAAIFALFGAINLLCFFWGDILLIYSVLSVCLFFFLRLSNRALLVAASLIFTIPSIFYCFPEMVYIFEHPLELMNNYYTKEEFIAVYQHGSFWEMSKARVLDYYYTYLPDITWHRTSFTCILLGYYLGRNQYHLSYLQYWQSLQKIFYLSASLSILYVLANFYGGYYVRLEPTFVLLKNVFILLSLYSYIFVILAIHKNKWLSKITPYFINMGKLSLSNYFLQQILCAFIFHNYGLGLYFASSPTQNFLLAIGIFIFQLVLSNWYLKKYNIGILEWVWRKLSY